LIPDAILEPGSSRRTLDNQHLVFLPGRFDQLSGDRRRLSVQSVLIGRLAGAMFEAAIFFLMVRRSEHQLSFPGLGECWPSGR
jgi:hypothetical protein